jgi:hypothetical protein
MQFRPNVLVLLWPTNGFKEVFSLTSLCASPATSYGKCYRLNCGHTDAQKIANVCHFHVDEECGSKVWTRRCESCLVQPWQHKQYTTVRIQFCKGYYGMRLQFIARVGKHTACTKIPIVVVKAGICKTRSLQNVPSVPQMRGKRRRGGEFREQLSDDSADSADISPVETAPSDDHVLSTCTLPVRGNPRRRKPDHQHPLQRACNLGEHSADQPNMKVTQSGTRRSNELDYALAEQLCSLQTLVRNSYK